LGWKRICCPGISWDEKDCVILELVGMEKNGLLWNWLEWKRMGYSGIGWNGKVWVTLELVGMEKIVLPWN